MACGADDLHRYRLVDLLPIWTDKDRCIEWCVQHQLMKREQACPGCFEPLRLVEDAKCAEERRWRCPRKGCQRRVSLRFDTLIYWWARDLPVVKAAEEVGVESKTAVLWYLRFRHICAEYLHQNSAPIGGAGHVVEVDGSKFGHRKYNRGRLRDGAWVVGGIDRATKEAFVRIVPDRSADTLIPILQENILPGTTVHSDEWAAYGALGENGYEHLTVNHSINFVNPDNGSHTQNIEALWSAAKVKLKRMKGTTKEMFPTYLVEFLWRRKYGESAFAHFIRHIAATFS